MINEVILSRLDELVGRFDTPFFSYLLYSYDLNMEDCEEIVDNLKRDIESNAVIPQNLVLTLEERFKLKVTELEKQGKLEYLDELTGEESEFFKRYLEGYGLSFGEIELVRDRVRTRILEDNISDFEIKRYLEYYFENSVRQGSYLAELNRIKGNGYDTLIIGKARREYPILTEADIVGIVFDIHTDIIDACEFKKSVRDDFLKRCMIRSEDKKAMCRNALKTFVFGKGDAFNKLVRSKGLEKRDGEIIVSQIMEDISNGLIQPERVNGYLLTKYFNEYNERQ